MRTVCSPSKPEVDLHITNRCQAQCDHCIYESGNAFNDELSHSELEVLFESFSRLGVKEVHVTGGEPLLREGIFDILSGLTTRGFQLRVQSNGKLLAQSAHMLRDCMVSEVLVSLDGTADIHDRIRGIPGLYEAAVQGIQACRNVGIRVRVNTVVRRDNLDVLDSLFSASAMLGVYRHSFFYMTPLGRARFIDTTLSISAYMKWASAFAASMSLDGRRRFRCQAAGVPRGEAQDMCRVDARDNILILANGDVFPCVTFAPPGHRLGNVRNTSLEEIWRRSPMWHELLDWRDQLAESAPCECCCGGCLGMWLASRSTRCDPRCSMQGIYMPYCVRRYMEAT